MTPDIENSKFYTDSIYSKNLSEYRKHNIYLPKGFNCKNKYSIIYATDGNLDSNANYMKSLLDSLINAKLIKPTIYVGSYSNSKLTNEYQTKGNGEKSYHSYRHFEYIETQYDSTNHDKKLASRFKNHLDYFTSEFIPHIERSLKIKASKKDRLFYGVSNGAGFGANLLNKHPNLIENYICFSTLGSNATSNIWNKNIKYPNLYLKYGDEESFVLKIMTDQIIEKYKSVNSFYDIEKYKGGHNAKSWNKKLEETLIKILNVEQ
ncbi:alpha/beta hydrolase [Pseudofulvibacter geojedonensis]|uniref:Alpha/beta hydrolase n=1 Tax=Pseudofulvibacter geojedonensis TaxID=1123758 RepID=A0ABW3I474_9FLAO